MRDVEILISKIIAGNKNWTDEDLQIYDNNKKEIEELLKEKLLELGEVKYGRRIF